MATPLGILLIKQESSAGQTTCRGHHNLYLPYCSACYDIRLFDFSLGEFVGERIEKKWYSPHTSFRVGPIPELVSKFYALAACYEMCVKPRKEPVKTIGLRTWKEIPVTISENCDMFQLRPPMSSPYGTRVVSSKANGREPSKRKVQPAALSALTQYYDLPLRCLTFQGFQLAPTLEDPYLTSLGDIILPRPQWPDYLRGGEVEEKSEWSRRDWLTFMDVYGILVYCIMLFPQIKHYIDLASVNPFLVLANTYHTFDYYSKKNGKGLRCCTLLLFLWLTVHLFHNSKKTRCPIEDHYWSSIRPLTKVEWTVCLDEAKEKSIY
ncbi:hypothetical protein CR513_21682, partial [Mucuna pruriens]